MQYSPPIPFVDATQNNVAHPNALKPGSEFVRLTMYTGERDPVPTWPWPTYTWSASLHGNSPSVPSPNGLIWSPAGEGGTTKNCNDWFLLGAYSVGLAPQGSGTLPWGSGYVGGVSGVPQLKGNNVIAWCAPGPIASIASTNYASPYSSFGLTSSAAPNMWDVDWTITTSLYPGGFYWTGSSWAKVDSGLTRSTS